MIFCSYLLCLLIIIYSIALSLFIFSFFLLFWLLFYFEVSQAGLCLILGTIFNINKEHQWINADRINDFVLLLNVVTVAVNIVINAFDKKETT